MHQRKTLAEALQEDLLDKLLGEVKRRTDTVNQEISSQRRWLFFQRKPPSGWVVVKEVEDYVRLFKQEWPEILRESSVREIDTDTFPSEIEVPILVFHSEEFCAPCWWTLPGFMALVPHFSRADVYYCKDSELQQSHGISFVPQLTAYFPDGKIVTSECGHASEALWENMNMLLTLGKAFDGMRGELICEYGTCRVRAPEQKAT